MIALWIVLAIVVVLVLALIAHLQRAHHAQEPRPGGVRATSTSSSSAATS